MTTYEITFNEHTDFGKNLLAFFEENKKYVKVNDNTKMKKEEFCSMLDEAREQIKRGEYSVYDENFRKNVLGLKD